MQLLDELLIITKALEDAQVDYAICGGLAVAIHGRPRMTVDIDLLMPADEIQQATLAVARVGFDDVTGWIPLPKNPHKIDFIMRINKFDEDAFLTLGLLETDSRSNSIFSQRQEFEIKGQRIHVLSRESLITMKSSTGRTQDRLDVEMLLDESS